MLPDGLSGKSGSCIFQYLLILPVQPVSALLNKLSVDGCRPPLPIYPQKVADIVRNRWPLSSGFTGRHAPDSLADFLRNTQSVQQE